MVDVTTSFSNLNQLATVESTAPRSWELRKISVQLGLSFAGAPVWFRSSVPTLQRKLGHTKLVRAVKDGDIRLLGSHEKELSVSLLQECSFWDDFGSNHGSGQSER